MKMSEERELKRLRFQAIKAGCERAGARIREQDEAKKQKRETAKTSELDRLRTQFSSQDCQDDKSSRGVSPSGASDINSSGKRKIHSSGRRVVN